MTTLARFALGAVEPVPDGGRLLALAEVLFELSGEIVIGDTQIVRRPDGRYEVRANQIWHTRVGWTDPLVLPPALGSEIAAEALAQLNSNGAQS